MGTTHAGLCSGISCIILIVGLIHNDISEMCIFALVLYSPMILFTPTIIYLCYMKYIRGGINFQTYEKIHLSNIALAIIIYTLIVSQNKDYYPEDMDKNDYIISRIGGTLFYL